jgi:hypothetical protein
LTEAIRERNGTRSIDPALREQILDAAVAQRPGNTAIPRGVRPVWREAVALMAVMLLVR